MLKDTNEISSEDDSIEENEQKSTPPKAAKKPNNLLISYINSCEKHNIISLIIVILSISIILYITIDECKKCLESKNDDRILERKITIYKETKKKLWAYGRNIESGYLHNLFEVLDRLGYENDPETENWDLLWAHDYPFRTLYAKLNNLKPHQRVNHFPGTGYITNKVDLATSNLKYIPPAFKLPIHRMDLLKYAEDNPNIEFVEKNNDHRNIKIKNLTDVDLNKNGTFVQKFVDRPLLVSGYKFDIGIYTIITSLDPLRVYIYNGDALLRFCPVEYYPFDHENLDKYVVGDDYLPTWEVPGLKMYYKTLGFGMKDSLNAYLRAQGKNPDVIWEQIEDALRIVILNKEPYILNVTNKFKSKRNFFEMMRFDFVVDEDLKVYLMEANMSPNLSSAHFPPNKLLFEQVIYNLMSLVGVGVRFHKSTLEMTDEETRMRSHDKNIAVYAEECARNCDDCSSVECRLCKNCLDEDERYDLLRAHTEHINRADCKRIFPPRVVKNSELPRGYDDYSIKNKMMYKWFLGKCLMNDAWCN